METDIVGRLKAAVAEAELRRVVMGHRNMCDADVRDILAAAEEITRLRLIIGTALNRLPVCENDGDLAEEVELIRGGYAGWDMSTRAPWVG